MADPTEREVLSLVKRRRRDVLGSEQRDRFENNAELAADFMAGRQKPSQWDDEKHEPFVVVNRIRDTVMRAASLGAAGITRVNLRAYDPRSEDLLDADRLDHELWQDMVKLNVRTPLRLQDVWLVGNSPARHTVEFDPWNMQRGVMAKLDMQVVNPQQAYWDLLADEPTAPLCGSNWIGWDTFMEREAVLQDFPDDRKALRKLGTVSGQSVEVETGDTVTPLLKAIKESGSLDQGDDDARIYGDGRTEYMRLTEFQWLRRENVDIEGVGKAPVGTWWKALIASSVTDSPMSEGPVLLDLRKLPYGMSTWSVICLEPPFGESVVTLLGDLQNAENVFASVVLKIAMIAARNMNRGVIDISKIDEGLHDQIRSSDMPDWFIADLSGDNAHAKAADVVTPLQFNNYDVGSIAGLLRVFGGELWDDVSGLKSIVTGEVSQASRLSSRSIGQLQQAVVMALEMLRQVAAVQVTHDAQIGRGLRRYHWAEARVLSGKSMKYPVNQRLPIAPTPDIVAQLISQPRQDDGSVVNGLRTVAGGEETVEPLSFDAFDNASARIAAGEADYMKLAANDLAAADDVEYRMEIESDHEERLQAAWDKTAALEQLRQGIHSERDLMDAAHATDPGYSYEEHLERKYAETGAREMLEAPPEDRDMARQMLRQLAQRREQAGAPAGNVPANAAA